MLCPSLREHSGRRGGKIVRAKAREACWEMASCERSRDASPEPSTRLPTQDYTNSFPLWMGKGSQDPTSSLKATGSWCLLRKRDSLLCLFVFCFCGQSPYRLVAHTLVINPALKSTWVPLKAHFQPVFDFMDVFKHFLISQPFVFFSHLFLSSAWLEMVF